ncbi:cbb3-type cytochrome c oxidase subunit II [Paraburkholderia humisilvae]|uniref:Cytochrome c6 n=1 Tax=Paraburkholderia humisilvae TaxID=627669 RepID=A0A6J5F5M9_9BURK|nr:cbb3-type cytochrome c oxidase subunit II [Paraburkholderia humisilvae]CAB3774150.1 Cytochrome c6 [Paraburkholderia humisilvae]
MLKILPRRGWFGTSQVILFIAGVGFFALSVVTLGVLPGLELLRAIHNDAPVTLSPYTEAQLRGRHIYATQGCAYCHSQQVRNTMEDVSRWGAPTEAWETKYDTPQLWGTRRIGPDLARETGVRSADWQLAHLYNPRLIVPDSVMPGYPWMFNGSAARPNRDALDLIAYLDTLGAARREAGCDARVARHAGTGPMMSEGAAIACVTLDASKSSARPIQPGSTGSTETLPAGDSRQGHALFQQSCAGCHGERGDGKSIVAAALHPAPADLTQVTYSDRALRNILENGVSGSSMPAWRDLSKQHMADIIAWLHTIDRAKNEDAPPISIIAQGARVYAKECAACHGVNGDGDGPVAPLIQPRPFDFTQARPSATAIEKVLRVGVPGTAMPAFAGLTERDRTAVTAYIRSVYEEADVRAPAAAQVERH